MKNIINKISKKIKDFFDVAKYKKQRNTAVTKYNARNEQYIEILETIPILVKKLDNYEEQIKKLKEERKELKIEIEERLKRKSRKG